MAIRTISNKKYQTTVPSINSDVCVLKGNNTNNTLCFLLTTNNCLPFHFSKWPNSINLTISVSHFDRLSMANFWLLGNFVCAFLFFSGGEDSLAELKRLQLLAHATFSRIWCSNFLHGKMKQLNDFSLWGREKPLAIISVQLSEELEFITRSYVIYNYVIHDQSNSKGPSKVKLETTAT